MKDIKDNDLPTFKTSHNDPEEVAQYLHDVTTLVNTFMESICRFNHYAKQDAYKYFVFELSKLLHNLDSTYFDNMNVDLMLDLIPDKNCKAYLKQPAKKAERNPVEQRVSTETIPTGPDVINQMQEEPDITLFDKAGKKSIIKLFSNLKDAHNHLAQVAGSIVKLGENTTPDQLGFVLRLAIRPLIQLKIPPNLASPVDTKFAKHQLTPEETFEEYCSNWVLPKAFHPKLSSIPFKHPTRCLAAATNFLIRKHMFDTKMAQLSMAKDFMVAEKKLHLATSGHKYDAGKKQPKKKHGTTPKKKDTTLKDNATKAMKDNDGTPDVVEVKEHRLSKTDTFNDTFDTEGLLEDDDASLPDPFAPVQKDKTEPMKTQPQEKLYHTEDPMTIPKKPKYK